MPQKSPLVTDPDESVAPDDLHLRALEPFAESLDLEQEGQLSPALAGKLEWPECAPGGGGECNSDSLAGTPLTQGTV